MSRNLKKEHKAYCYTTLAHSYLLLLVVIIIHYNNIILFFCFVLMILCVLGFIVKINLNCTAASKVYIPFSGDVL